MYPGTVNVNFGTPTIGQQVVNPIINNITFSQATYCPGEAISLTIDGTLNDATEWVVYNNDGCGVTEVTRSTSNTIGLGSRSTTGTTTIYVRGEGVGITTPPDCFEASIVVGGIAPEITSLSLNQATFLPGENIELSINGNLNDATEWVVYNEDGCGVTEVTRSTSNTISLGSRSTFGTTRIYVRGEGNCVEDVLCVSIDIEVVDSSPVITCPADVTVNAGDSIDPSSIGSATSTGGFGDVDITNSDSWTSDSLLTRTWTATDANGNSSSCVQRITVVITNRNLVCPGNQNLSADASGMALLPDFTDLVTVNMGTGGTGGTADSDEPSWILWALVFGQEATRLAILASIEQTPAPGTPLGVGTTTVTMTSGSYSCSFEVVVSSIDNTPPVLTNCPLAIELDSFASNPECGDFGEWGATNGFG